MGVSFREIVTMIGSNKRSERFDRIQVNKITKILENILALLFSETIIDNKNKPQIYFKQYTKQINNGEQKQFNIPLDRILFKFQTIQYTSTITK